MKRIDTINARENMFGVGKSGFHDNVDLPGQDATYVSPEWFNTVQEELCNLLELRGITLDPASKRQLYDLLTTQADLEALADEIETNFIRKSQIVDNLTTNDSYKPVSAKQAKVLQDTKLGKADLKNASTSQKGIVKLNNTLISDAEDEAATAGTVKRLNDRFTNDFLNTRTEIGYQKYPNGRIEQWARITASGKKIFTFPVSFSKCITDISVVYLSTTNDTQNVMNLHVDKNSISLTSLAVFAGTRASEQEVIIKVSGY